ncbi:MAG: hypothetical protein KGL39_39780 [Patescibacteria group bacterium]|nr:hypothetical protein [Patescibacteria group bacterium]
MDTNWFIECDRPDAPIPYFRAVRHLDEHRSEITDWNKSRAEVQLFIDVLEASVPFMNEQQVRQLRAAIYGECSDKNWHACKSTENGNGWMAPSEIQWLAEHQPIDQPFRP